jgi:hypothetical protein
VLSLGTLEVAAGAVFRVPVSIENAIDMDGWTVEFTFDPEVIRPTAGVDFTSFLDGDPIGPDFEEGRVSLGELGTGEAVSGDGVLAYVEFTALRPGTTALALGETGILGPSGWQPHVTQDGVVVVSEEATPVPPTATGTVIPVTATATSTSTPEPTDTPTPTPTPLPQQTELRLPALEVADDTVFFVPVEIENAVALEGWTAEFSYDPEIISRTLQVVFTSFLDGDPLGPNFADGTVSLGEYGSEEAASGDGVLAFVEFIAVRPGISELTFGQTGLLGPGGWQPHGTRDGYVVVIGGVTPPPTPLPTDTPTVPPPPPTNTPTVGPPSTNTPTATPWSTSTPAATPSSTSTPTATPPDSPIGTPTSTSTSTPTSTPTATPPDSPVETPTPTYPSSPTGGAPERGIAFAAGLPLLALLLAVVTWGSARGGLATVAQRFWRGR